MHYQVVLTETECWVAYRFLILAANADPISPICKDAASVAAKIAHITGEPIFRCPDCGRWTAADFCEYCEEVSDE